MIILNNYTKINVIMRKKMLHFYRELHKLFRMSYLTYLESGI